jgi:hypothetical protein
MAERQRIPRAQKSQLVQEAGGKCANPGCSHWRTHIHHIKHWSAYRAHDSQHMIAVCPTCHDEIHRGGGISDKTLYQWKKLVRNATDITGHIYVEPSTEIRVLTGSMCVTTDNAEAIVFTLSNTNKFRFKIRGDGDIFLASCTIRDLSGAYLVRVFDNHFKIKNDRMLTVDQRPGKIRVMVCDAENYLPSWTLKIIRKSQPEFVRNNRIVVLDIEVIRPGVVRLQGVFVADDAVLAITEETVFIMRPEINGMVAFVGGGEGTEIRLSGPITRAAYGDFEVTLSSLKQG